MEKWKWRLVLSIANLSLALGMSALGAQEWAADLIVHPQYFYHGNLYYSPTAQWLSYCLNAPSLYVTNLFGTFAMRYHLLPPSWFETYCFYFVHYEYYLALFLFWWWIGREFDLPLDPRRRNPSFTVAEAVLGILLSIGLLFQGLAGYRRGDVIHAIAASMVGWGAGLMYYCFFLLWRTKRPHVSV